VTYIDIYARRFMYLLILHPQFLLYAHRRLAQCFRLGAPLSLSLSLSLSLCIYLSISLLLSLPFCFLFFIPIKSLEASRGYECRLVTFRTIIFLFYTHTRVVIRNTFMHVYTHTSRGFRIFSLFAPLLHYLSEELGVRSVSLHINEKICDFPPSSSSRSSSSNSSSCSSRCRTCEKRKS